MREIKCPYCGEEQDINHEDGYGYEEDVLHEQECVKCEREFKFQTRISTHYDVYCNGDHDMYSPFRGIAYCNRCDHFETRAALREGEG